MAKASTPYFALMIANDDNFDMRISKNNRYSLAGHYGTDRFQHNW